MMEGISLLILLFFDCNKLHETTNPTGFKSVGFLINYILINDSNFPIPLDHVYA
jgi:hypothetical protein